MYPKLEHPEIGWIERTGYPSWLQERDHTEEYDEYDEDAIYQEQVEAKHGW